MQAQRPSPAKYPTVPQGAADSVVGQFEGLFEDAVTAGAPTTFNVSRLAGMYITLQCNGARCWFWFAASAAQARLTTDNLSAESLALGVAFQALDGERVHVVVPGLKAGGDSSVHLRVDPVSGTASVSVAKT